MNNWCSLLVSNKISVDDTCCLRFKKVNQMLSWIFILVKKFQNLNIVKVFILINTLVHYYCIMKFSKVSSRRKGVTLDLFTLPWSVKTLENLEWLLNIMLCNVCFKCIRMFILSKLLNRTLFFILKSLALFLLSF